MNRDLHVVVLKGGWSAEREVSLMSGRGVAEALRGNGWSRVTELDMGRDVAVRLAELKPDVVFNALHGTPGEPEAIGAEMDRSAAEREASQPLRSRTGGSTFKNPSGHKAWALIDAAGCRGLTIGDAQVSEKHCNFLLNLGSATSTQIEDLGEEVRRRVMEKCNIQLEWEIQRIGSYE